MNKIATQEMIDGGRAACRAYVDEVKRLADVAGQNTGQNDTQKAIQSAVSLLILEGSDLVKQPEVIEAIGFALGAAFAQWGPEGLILAPMVLQDGFSKGWASASLVVQQPAGRA